MRLAGSMWLLARMKVIECYSRGRRLWVCGDGLGDFES